MLSVFKASVHRCNATVTFNANDQKPFYPVTVNDKDLHEHFQKVEGNMLGGHNVLEMQPMMGAEDFSIYAEVIPGYLVYIGMKNETKGKFKRGHSPYFMVNEDALPYGAALHASVVTKYLLENKPKPNLPKAVSFRDEL
ncbi:hypothetical protein F2P56_002246 [Juglans regia]|uniref:IAA-amino acid hydrolase ILR1-like 4 n=2 Tax=Juglans regia TaxID=51240 RepID=A0A833YC37_JUGRE|nr:IAA-amino acid hydrolase ILR1-like 4 [Juglans regia]KAF5481606.1 hypothetical protein F2P56_002246 [Juglans regia]